MVNWFQTLFGFTEIYDDIGEKIHLEHREGSMILKSVANEKEYSVGRFETPTIASLRQGLETAKEIQTEKGKRLLESNGKSTVTLITGDISRVIARPENIWATFQVASQFNCLEFPFPEKKPEEGVTDYFDDRTQGPACCIACGPATVYRNYFADVWDKESQKCVPGQTAARQIDNLSELSKALGMVGEECKYYRVVGGYTLSDDKRLKCLRDRLPVYGTPEYEELIGLLKVGAHRDVQVTSQNWGKEPVEDQNALVNQVFTSACSVSYSDGNPCMWEPFAQLILNGAYEATFSLALLNAVQRTFQGASKRVFLTLVGAGVFGNDLRWVIKAIKRAFLMFSHFGLEVIIVNYGSIPDEVEDLARELNSLME